MRLFHLERNGRIGCKERRVTQLQTHLRCTESRRRHGHKHLRQIQLLVRQNHPPAEIIQAEHICCRRQLTAAGNHLLATPNSQCHIVHFRIQRVNRQMVQPQGRMVQSHQPIVVLNPRITHTHVLDFQPNRERLFLLFVLMERIDQELVVHHAVHLHTVVHLEDRMRVQPHMRQIDATERHLIVLE